MPDKKVTCNCRKTMREPNDDQLVAKIQKHVHDAHNYQVRAMAEPA